MRTFVLDSQGREVRRAAGFIPSLRIESSETIDLISGTFVPVDETDESESSTKRERPETNAVLPRE